MAPSVFRFSLGLLAVLLAAGCASSSPMSRIDANRALYESWPFEIQEAVLNGRVVAGMTPEMVEMVLGKPKEIMSRQGKKGEEEVWTYKKRQPMGNILSGTHISMGGNIGGVGIGGPILGSGSSIPAPGPEPVEDAMDVVFQNGLVVRADPELSKGK
ncbi:MAG: hypothetical protein HYX71_11515 [Opitutae bacterium]|nr:hypothetical protein [Opitutae bacterium]